MIKITKFNTNDKELVLNAELIETIEETPDICVS